MSVPIDLTTSTGRRRARNDLFWGDHGFLRLRFRNLHQISEEMFRANQPSPEHIARYARDLGLKTVINLRGRSPKGYYLLEKEACARNGIELVDFQMFSREVPPSEAVLQAKQLFDSIAYPALMHCKSGADRAGIMAVLYLHFRKGQPIESALEMLSGKYLHIRHGKTGILDYFFETYMREAQPKGLSFLEWVQAGYDRVEMKRRFLQMRSRKIDFSKLLQRE